MMEVSSETIERAKEIAEGRGLYWRFEQDNCLYESPDFEMGGLIMKHEDVGLRIWTIQIGKSIRKFHNWIDTNAELTEWLNRCERTGGA